MKRYLCTFTLALVGCLWAVALVADDTKKDGEKSDKQTQEQQSKQAATRKSLVGSGDRSGRIRTYNFPQGRITDHRINLTLYKIEQIMDGDLNELCSTLMSEHQAEQLAAMAE